MGSIEDVFAHQVPYAQAQYTSEDGRILAVLCLLRSRDDTAGHERAGARASHYWLRLFTGAAAGNYGPAPLTHLEPILLGEAISLDRGWATKADTPQTPPGTGNGGW